MHLYLSQLDTVMLAGLLDIITILLYLMAIGLQCMSIISNGRFSKVAALLIGYCAVFLHTVLLHHWIDIDSGQNLTFLNMFSLIAWLVSLLILLFALRKPIEILLIFVFPFSALSIVLIMIFPNSYIINMAAEPKQLFHILLAALTFSMLCVAGLQAILLAIQEKRLRDKQMHGLMHSLPALETMETLLFQIIGLGFLLLSVMIGTSWYFFHSIQTNILQQKNIIVISAWIIFGSLLVGRYCFGWRSRKAIYGTLIGVTLLVVTYFGSVVLMELIP